jgi:hypothetical protein
MRIRIYDIGKYIHLKPEDLGLVRCRMSLPSTFDVTDKELFFLSVIKYGIKFKEV